MDAFSELIQSAVSAFAAARDEARKQAEEQLRAQHIRRRPPKPVMRQAEEQRAKPRKPAAPVPVAHAEEVHHTSEAQFAVGELFGSRDALLRMVIGAEILSPPIALR